MMPLGQLQEYERAEVVEVKTGRDTFSSENSVNSTAGKNCQYRLEDMGLRAGKIVEVLSNEGRGPLLLRIDELRIAVGRGMAMKIMVRRIEI